MHYISFVACCRNQLGSLLLSSEDWMASHKAVRVTSLSRGYTSNRGLRSPHQIQACAAVSCYATCTSYPKFSFPTCEDQYLSGYNAICRLQRYIFSYYIYHVSNILVCDLTLSLRFDCNNLAHICQRTIYPTKQALMLIPTGDVTTIHALYF